MKKKQQTFTVQVERATVEAWHLIEPGCEHGEDFGPAETILTSKRHMSEVAALFVNTPPVESEWGGWLGRYQTALKRASEVLEETKKVNSLVVGRLAPGGGRR